CGGVSYMSVLESIHCVAYKINIVNIILAEDFNGNIDNLVFDTEVRKQYLTPSQNAYFKRFLDDTVLDQLYMHLIKMIQMYS
ncbi:hypothetical protein NAI68_09875, partial [Francisella tularensis subsp. holarctica]|nr:hypothetical protein [Francisella tularensis subsp. holarctica]